MDKQTALIIDDDPSSVSLLNELLCTQYLVKVASNGPLGIHLAFNEEPPALIFLGLLVPTMDGFDVCSILKHYRKTQSIPIVFLSSNDFDSGVKLGLAMGAEACLTKPVSAIKLDAILASHIARAGAATPQPKPKNPR